MKPFADSHVHIDGDTDASVRYMLDTLRDLGITDASLLSLVASPKHDIFQNLSTLHYKRTYTDIRLRAFGSFHETDLYAGIPYLEQTEALLELGCDGIKFLHMKPDLRKVLGRGINHPDYDAAFSLMEERDVPVTIHSGDPETFWDPSCVNPYQISRGWFYGDGTFPTCQQIYDEDFAMLDKHPRLRVTFAHFFFLSNRLDEAKRIMDKYPNVSFDLTPGWEMYLGFSKNIDAWRDFFIEHSDRILYGTDSNDTKKHNPKIHELVRTALRHDRTETAMPDHPGYTMRGLELPESVIDRICYGNYVRFVGENPEPVNAAALLTAAERMLADLDGSEGNEKATAWLRGFIKNA